MYTYTDIKLQNQQDAFSAMFLYVSRNILRLCGPAAPAAAGRWNGCALPA